MFLGGFFEGGDLERDRVCFRGFRGGEEYVLGWGEGMF